MKILKQHSTPRRGCVCAGRVLLVDRGGKHQPYVTWWENTDLGGRYWGHYFDDYSEAKADFETRCKRGY